jgi:hypothetical protein
MFTPFDTCITDSNLALNINKLIVDGDVGLQYVDLTSNQTVSNKTFTDPIASSLVLNGNASASTADITFNNGLKIKSLVTACASNGSTSLNAGTMVMTSNATGLGLLFMSNGTALKQVAFV